MLARASTPPSPPIDPAASPCIGSVQLVQRPGRAARRWHRDCDDVGSAAVDVRAAAAPPWRAAVTRARARAPRASSESTRHACSRPEEEGRRTGRGDGGVNDAASAAAVGERREPRAAGRARQRRPSRADRPRGCSNPAAMRAGGARVGDALRGAAQAGRLAALADALVGGSRHDGGDAGRGVRGRASTPVALSRARSQRRGARALVRDPKSEDRSSTSR